MTTHALVSVVFLLVADNGPRQDAVRTELERLKGTWTWKSTEMFGKQAPFSWPGKAIRIDGNKMILVEDGKDVTDTEIRLTLDPARKPKTMDLTTKQGKKVLTDKCIYALDGDELKICLEGVDKPEKERQRPKSFDTTGPEAYQVMTFARKKP